NGNIIGNLTNLIATGSPIRQIATTSVGGSPISVFVSGRYAYVTNHGSSSLSVVDISKPSAPIQISTTSIGSAPQSVYVSGQYAYITHDDGGAKTLTIVDVSN